MMQGFLYSNDNVKYVVSCTTAKVWLAAMSNVELVRNEHATVQSVLGIDTVVTVREPVIYKLRIQPFADRANRPTSGLEQYRLYSLPVVSTLITLVESIQLGSFEEVIEITPFCTTMVIVV